MTETLLTTPTAIPVGFPLAAVSPKFKLGERVQWQPIPTQDSGTIIGIQYLPVPQLQTWAWKYTIWLDAFSPSRSWVSLDTAWEVSLEKIPTPNSRSTIEEAKL